MSAFDEVYSQTATFTPTEEWMETQGDNWEGLKSEPVKVHPLDCENNWHQTYFAAKCPDCEMGKGLLGDDKPIKTIERAHLSLEVDFQGIPKKTLGLIFGVDRYMHEYGKHRIKDINRWEHKTFDVDQMNCVIGTYMFLFNEDHRKFKHTPRIPLCPIGLGAK